MRSRWQDWVIAITIVALGVTGVMAIWGDQIKGLVRGEKKSAEKAPDAVAVPSPGNAAGPF